MKKGVIFDLDGTLVNTLADLTNAMNFALNELGCPARSSEECRQMIGRGLRNFAYEALPDDKKDLCGQLVERMVSRYQQHCLEETTVYDGIYETVEELARRGLRLAVLTNKKQKPTDLIIRHFFKPGLFNPVIGENDGRKVKPDPQTTLEIIAGWGLTSHEILYAGDSDIDIHTARAAGVQCVGCEWGFRSRRQLLDAGAEILIQQPQQLLNLLD
ncbi:MAG TPA: HAD family hydrolase [Anaerohalosphaeraceae bacterium]|nr:HAD family hydrolase [Phycisphaerae bacterium]HOK96771.1 HAD family hydrolase [Anaerohalosphaeraceae bacterium]HOL32160.1 HAD family hydrolase [Anaerohalosphaeraceae bacterium]HOM77148.1 HAD family hydrolase [Anaerohalosphaeraceae bacterium]HPC65114.1 HAD family hydrolase [Anaerohalosphaeraceae bacterium]